MLTQRKPDTTPKDPQVAGWVGLRARPRGWAVVQANGQLSSCSTCPPAFAAPNYAYKHKSQGWPPRRALGRAAQCAPQTCAGQPRERWLKGQKNLGMNKNDDVALLKGQNALCRRSSFPARIVEPRQICCIWPMKEPWTSRGQDAGCSGGKVCGRALLRRSLEIRVRYLNFAGLAGRSRHVWASGNMGQRRSRDACNREDHVKAPGCQARMWRHASSCGLLAGYDPHSGRQT
jgi:hypothetical protein